MYTCKKDNRCRASWFSRACSDLCRKIYVTVTYIN